MKRRTALGLFLLLATLAIWWAARPQPASPPSRSQPSPPVAATPSPPAPSPRPQPPAESPQLPAAPAAPAAEPPATPDRPPAAAVPAANLPGSVETDLESVQFMIRDFRTSLRENPVGNNAEITQALLGRNAKQLKLELPAGSQLNAAGELLDRWGTPYFFHQLSRDKMEVRSAGPDRSMWTGDDSQQ